MDRRNARCLPDGADENIKAAAFRLHVIEERLALSRVRVIDPHRYAKTAAVRDFFRSVFDIAGNPIDRWVPREWNDR